LEPEFKRYLLDVLTDTLYISAKEEYERHVAAEPEKLNSEPQERQYLKELERTAKRYAAEAIDELESKGLHSHGALLSNQAIVKETMGILQRKMFDELSAGRGA
jgi:hypothetical protein